MTPPRPELPDLDVPERAALLRLVPVHPLPCQLARDGGRAREQDHRRPPRRPAGPPCGAAPTAGLAREEARALAPARPPPRAAGPAAASAGRPDRAGSGPGPSVPGPPPAWPACRLAVKEERRMRERREARSPPAHARRPIPAPRPRVAARSCRRRARARARPRCPGRAPGEGRPARRASRRSAASGSSPDSLEIVEGAAGGVATDRPPGWARHEPRSLSINVVRLRRFRNDDRPARCRLHPAAHDRGYHVCEEVYRSTVVRHRFALMRPWAPGRADRSGPGPASCSRAAR